MLMRRIVVSISCGLAVQILNRPAFAGMPSPVLIVSELGKRRLEEISFFLMLFLVMTVVVRYVWNTLARDIQALPHLSFRGAICFMLLIGLALTVVLSLVSGARELMTPAAWEPNGITYRLAKGTPDANPWDEISERRFQLESLKKNLWEFAASHDSKFPSDINELPFEATVADRASGLKFVLQPDLTTITPRAVLASEPDIYPTRLLLLTDGKIVSENRREKGAP